MFGFGSTSFAFPSHSIIPTIHDTFNLGSGTKSFFKAYLSRSLVFSSATSGIAKIEQFNTDAATALCGGPDADIADGSFIAVYGDMFSGKPGQIEIFGGNNATSHITTKLGHASALKKFQDSSAADFLAFSSPSATNLEIIFGSGSTAAQVLTIRGNRSDGSDDGRLVLCGGNGSGSSRGASVTIHGNEYSGAGGAAALWGGDVSTGHISLRAVHSSAEVQVYTANTLRWRWSAAGALLPATTLNIGSTSQDAGSVYARFIGTGGANALGLFSNNVTRWNLTVAGHLVPAAAATSNLGSVANNLVQVFTGGVGNGANAPLLLFANNLNRWSVDTTGNFAQNATNGGSIILGNANTSVRQPTGGSISAAGSVIGDATQLVAVYNQVTTVGAGQGVKLWDAGNGTALFVQNLGANDLELYPPDASSVFNSAAAGSPITLAAATNQIAVCFKIAANTWAALVGNGPDT